MLKSTESDQPADAIRLVPAGRDDKQIVANLLELYCHDFSEFVDLELGPDGRYGYPWLPLYWIEPGRFPFLVQVGGKLAGFVLVHETKAPEAFRDVAEFFVIRSHRRKGVGRSVAHALWRGAEGNWRVRVRENNHPAVAFWHDAIATFLGTEPPVQRVETDGAVRIIYRFRTPPAPR